MKVLKQMVHTALRDDTALRAILGQTQTPYGVHEAFVPEPKDYKSLSYVTWQSLGGPAEGGFGADPEMRRREKTFAVTVWSRNPDTVEDAHQRIRRILIDMYRVTPPASAADVHGVEHVDEGPDLFDDPQQVYFRAETYRVKFREDVAA